MRWTVLLLVAACSSQSASIDSGAGRSCPSLEGKTFASLTQGECGLGPNGPTQCTWHIMFAAADANMSSYTWQHSDVGESGDVYCAGSLVIDTRGSAGPRGTYDAASGQLVWAGVTYAP